MNSLTTGCVQSSPVSTTTNIQCAFSNTFTTLRARGLSQLPTGTATLVVSIDSNGIIAVGGLARATTNLLNEARQLLTSNWTKTVALDAGTTGQVLTANSLAADGIEWVNLPTAMMYGTPPSPTYVNSSLSQGSNAITAGTWSIAIGNNVLTSAEPSLQCNVAIGSYNLQNLTTGQYNTRMAPGQWK